MSLVFESEDYPGDPTQGRKSQRIIAFHPPTEKIFIKQSVVSGNKVARRNLPYLAVKLYPIVISTIFIYYSDATQSR
jgi:hypothetical protein